MSATTDFFERQDRARHQTTHLLVMFAAAVAAIVVIVYLIAVVCVSARHGDPRMPQGAIQLWNPGLFVAVAGGTLLVISLGSAYKVAELASGGSTVAMMMGGRLVDSQTTDLAERRLLNVVEEMSIASGVPVPPVYVMDDEPSINAFAAGHRPADAVVAVSRGCLMYLTRDELQGVLGHEFSHVLNGDMRLNLRLIGIVYGILVLSIIGYYIMQSVQYSGPSRSDDERKGDNRMAFFLVGLALYILGYLGVLFGNIIKSAISRQREFLADASSVQFTRNPAGLAMALKKIGGLAAGSTIRDPHAHEISHMFFGDAFGGSMLNLFATHPPLGQRIQLLDPAFNGEFPEVQPLVESAQTAEPRQAAARRPALPGFQGAGAILTSAGMPAGVLPPGSLPAMGLADEGGSPPGVAQVGRPQVSDYDRASQIVSAVPPALVDAAHEPFSARALLFALVLARDDGATRDRQWQMLQSQIEPPALQLTQRLFAAIGSVPPEGRLPLVDLAMPALKRFSKQQYVAFRQVVDALTQADGTIDLFEYCLRVLLFGYLDVNFGLRAAPAVRYKTVAAVDQPIAVLLSGLAYAGSDDSGEIQKAFAAGAKDLLGQAAVLPAVNCGLAAFDAALGQLAQASPQVKKAVLAGVVACIAADGKTTLEEGELLRAISASLGCPMPPGAGI